MSERKVLNKYYPPDFDPSQLKRIKVEKPKQHTVRIMTPFNMKCNTCGDYISKAKKFNARKETIEGDNYLGLHKYRFYIKCPQCMAEITFITNPETADYEMEFGAHRNFDALRLAVLKEEREIEQEKEEEKINPMKLLENRTKQSKEEMEELEKLAQLKEENANKQVVDVDQIIETVVDKKDEKKLLEEKLKEEEEEDERIAKEWMKLATQSKIENNEIKSSIGNIFKSKDKSTNLLTNDTNIKKRKLESLIPIKKKFINNDIKLNDNDKNDKTIDKPKLISSLCNYSDSDDSN